MDHHSGETVVILLSDLGVECDDALKQTGISLIEKRIGELLDLAGEHLEY